MRRSHHAKLHRGRTEAEFNAGAVDLPVIASGGIMTAADAIEYLMAGATAVQVGTATFTNPRAPLDVLQGMEQWLARERIADVHEIIGAARPTPRTSSSWADALGTGPPSSATRIAHAGATSTGPLPSRTG